MPASPPGVPAAIVPNYWTFSLLSFNRSLEFASNPDLQTAQANNIQVFDINNDGHLDVVVLYSHPIDDGGVPIRVLLGDGHGGFSDGTASLFGANVPLSSAQTGVHTNDFNGDGRLDLFISQHGYDFPPFPGLQNRLILSSGETSVVDATSTNLPQISDFTHWSTSADIDGDGDIDIFVHNVGAIDNNRSAYFLLNDGSGVFTRSDSQLPAAIDDGTREYVSSRLFDADNDGDADLLLGMWGAQAAGSGSGAFASLVLFNDGTGHFSQTANSVLPTSIYDVTQTDVLGSAAVDITGDGFLDLFLLTTTPGNRYVQVLINNGDGTFYDDTAARLDASQVVTTGNQGGRYLHIVDVNADGASDLLLETGGARRFFLNDGTAHFIALPGDFLFTNDDYAFVPGDFNEDGRLDFFVRLYTDFWSDPDNVTEYAWIATWTQPADTTLDGDGAANAVLGVGIDEFLNGLGGDDVIFAGAGNDTLAGGADADYLNGGAGVDTASYADSGSGVTVDLATGAGTGGDAQGDALQFVENLVGSAFSDTLTGDSGANALDGGAGADTMAGGDGDDTYVVDNAGDAVTETAGHGADTVQASITWTLGANVENLTLTGVAALTGIGNTLNNTVTGNDSDDVLYGKTGDDALNAAGGSDTLWGGDGNDVLNGGLGNDFLDAGNNNDTLNGGDGTDTLYGRAGNDVLDGGIGADTMFGGAGDDTYVVDNATDTVAENSASGIDTVQASVTYGLGAFIENLTLTGAVAINGIGNILGNTMIGNDAANTLSGVAGADTLYGMGGNDTLNGGNGNDTLSGGAGNDILDGGNNDDTLNGGDDNDTLYGRTQNDTLNGDAGADTLYGGDGNDVLNGGADNDLLDGGNHNDTLSGGDGNDTLYGRQNDDALNGNDGNDTLYGGDGVDTLNGGAGADVLNGGNGDDVFAFAAGEANGDTLQDFIGNGAAAGDTIVFSGYGLAINGATFVQIDATHWQINSADGLTHDTIIVSNGATFDASDYLFG